MTIDGLPDMDAEDREAFRQSLQKYWGGWLQEKARVQFEDECPECGLPMVDTYPQSPHATYRCDNPNCVVNLPQLAEG
jgi:hypothetical protein